LNLYVCSLIFFLQFNKHSKKGAVFHLIGALSEYGKCGVTCIADSPAEAEEIFTRVIATLDKETQKDDPYVY